MVDDSLVEYVRDLLKKGYKEDYIRAFLLKNGYKASHITATFAQVKQRKISKPLLYGSIGGIIIVILVTTILLWPSGSSRATIQVSIEGTTTIAQGDTLSFHSTLTSTEDSPTLVTLKYDIIDETNKPLQSAQDTITVRASTKRSAEITLSRQLEPGTYSLQVTAGYDEQHTQDSYQFTITPGTLTGDELHLDTCPYDCDDGDPCTTDRCEDGRCVYVRQQPCCGDNICEGEESVLTCSEDCTARVQEDPDNYQDKAIELARTNKAQAANECNKIGLLDERDSCFLAVADEANDPVFCEPLSSINLKDSCYLGFSKHPGICLKIQDELLKLHCQQAVQFSRENPITICQQIQDEEERRNCEGVARAAEERAAV
ncbi:hypothetical protein GF342_01650 [Candidatus Woesearchaeota archaeon]|nr:hypothetical protein [Candidatus Woesearchaeota archaeon]